MSVLMQAEKRRQADLQASADKAKAAKDPAAAAAAARRKWWGEQQREEREKRQAAGEDGEDEDDDIAYYRYAIWWSGSIQSLNWVCVGQSFVSQVLVGCPSLVG